MGMTGLTQQPPYRTNPATRSLRLQLWGYARRPNTPALLEWQDALSTLCAAHSLKGITLRFSPVLTGANACAIPEAQGILLSEELVHRIKDPDERRGLLAHELAHILLRNVDDPSPDAEYDADTVALQLLGEKEPLKSGLIHLARLCDEETRKALQSRIRSIADQPIPTGHLLGSVITTHHLAHIPIPSRGR